MEKGTRGRIWGYQAFSRCSSWTESSNNRLSSEKTDNFNFYTRTHTRSFAPQMFTERSSGDRCRGLGSAGPGRRGRLLEAQRQLTCVHAWWGSAVRPPTFPSTALQAVDTLHPRPAWAGGATPSAAFLSTVSAVSLLPRLWDCQQRSVSPRSHRRAHLQRPRVGAGQNLQCSLQSVVDQTTWFSHVTSGI